MRHDVRHLLPQHVPLRRGRQQQHGRLLANPTGPAADWAAVYVGAGAIAQGGPNQREIMGVSCPSAQLCVAVSFEGLVYTSTDPTGAASAWSTAPGGGTVQITGASCPSASRCLAVDDNGDAIASTEPTAAGSWELTKVAPYPGPEEVAGNGMFGVSCPTGTLCAVGGVGRPDLHQRRPLRRIGPARQEEGRRHRKRPKRPRVTIAKGPEPGTAIHGNTTCHPTRYPDCIKHVPVTSTPPQSLQRSAYRSDPLKSPG